MKKILWTLAFVFALQVSASTALAAPKDTVNQVEAYSDTTSLDSTMNAAMGNWDDPDDWDDDWDEWEKNFSVVKETAVHKNMIQTAQRMKRDGMDSKLISRYTGLTVAEIESL